MDVDASRAKVKKKDGSVSATASVNTRRVCMLYVRVVDRVEYEIDKVQLEKLLGCQMWQYTSGA